MNRQSNNRSPILDELFESDQHGIILGDDFLEREHLGFVVFLFLIKKPEHDRAHYDRKAHSADGLNDYINIVHRYSPSFEKHIHAQDKCISGLPGLSVGVVLLYIIIPNFA